MPHRQPLPLTVLILLIAFLPEAVAQVAPDSAAVEEDVAATLDALDISADAGAQLIEQLTNRAAHPLNLNAASASELASLPFVTPFLARRIIAHRTQHGLFKTWADVRRLSDGSPEWVDRLRPYAHLGPATPAPNAWSRRALANNLSGQFIQRITRRLDLGRGYARDTARTTYRGSPERIYTRFTLTANNRLQANLTLDKDPGEAFQWDPSTATYGYDHVAGHLALRNLGPIESLVFGDFTGGFGQGVTLWQGFSFGKSRSPVRGLVRHDDGIKAFGSTEENRFFRGAALTIRPHDALVFNGFASRRQRDARIVTLPADTAAESTPRRTLSLAESGLHRTPTELRQKDAAREETVGGNIRFSTETLSLGAVGHWTRYTPPRMRSARPDDRFALTGPSAHVVGLYGTALWNDVLFFGEAARSSSGTIAGLGGLQIDATPWAEVLLLGRHYPPTFANPHGGAFGERSGATQNESGLYAGLRIWVRPDLRIAAYVDQYRFPWLRFGVARPTAGYEARLIAEHEPYDWLSYYAQLHTETNEQAAETKSRQQRTVEAVHPETRSSLRLHGQFAFSSDLHFRTRLEAVRFRTPANVQRGVLLYQGVRWTPIRRIQLDGRIALFETDGFGARIYAYEHDLLYAFSIPVLSGRGQRSYLKVTFRPTRTLTLEVKYAVSRFQGVDTVGSGLEAISGNRRRDLRVQLRWAW